MLHKDIIDRLSPNLFLPRLNAETKEEAIMELLKNMCRGGHISTCNIEYYYQEFLKRESKGSTYLGNYLATPHIKLQDFEGILFTIGLSHSGIDFNGKTAHVIIAILCDQSNNSIYLNFLSFIAGTFRNPKSVNKILEMNTDTEIYNFIAGEHS